MKPSEIDPAWLRTALEYNPGTGLIKSRGGTFYYENSFRRLPPKGKVMGLIVPTHGYVRITVGPFHFIGHRLAWALHYGSWPEQQIDHINGNRCDNRIVNLRDVAPIVNARNRRCPSPYGNCGVVGVRAHLNGAYSAEIYANKRKRYLGTFKSLDDARNAYLSAKAERDSTKGAPHEV